METESSLNRSIDNAKKHYSSMFTLPTFKTALLALAALSLVIGLSSYVVYPHMGLAVCLVLGVSFFASTVIADLVVSQVLLKDDPIFLIRRTSVLSLFSLALWFAFIIVGVVLSFPFGWLLWVELSLLGYAFTVTVRIVILIATSTGASWRRGLSVLLQPTLCLAAFVFFWSGIKAALPLQVLPYIVFSPVIGLIAALAFYGSIKRLSRSYKMNAIPLFQAFIVNWVTSLNEPLEKQLEEMGENTDIEVNLIKFEASKPQAAIIVPQVHPGPFKNIGSSLLPSLLKAGFEKEYRCGTCTPLGILGHELDLASQQQNHKIVSEVIASANFKATESFASPFVRVKEGVATASCQIFGDTVFLCFTLAPHTTEDLPQELGRFVSEEAAKLGLKNAIVVNTHNSLENDTLAVDQHLGDLQAAASKCLQKAVTLPTHPFMTGSASVFPKEFSLKAGMGTGGITAVAVEVEAQKAVYVVIDGNNMVPGLREKILETLASIGFTESEVFTTDTHAVSALESGRRGSRGYHPVGEVMDQNLLILYICDAAKNAAANLAASRAGFLHLVVPQVRVIGEARLNSLTTLVDKALQRAKFVLVPVFGLEALFLVLLLFFLLR